MKKDDAKTILSNICEEIRTHIDQNDKEVDEAPLIDFLHDVAHAVVNNDFKQHFDFHSQQLSFEEEYKLLAEQSLDSYSNTSEKFSELSKAGEGTAFPCRVYFSNGL